MLSSVQKSKIKQNKSLQWTELKHCEKQGGKKEEEMVVILKSLKYTSSL